MRGVGCRPSLLPRPPCELDASRLAKPRPELAAHSPLGGGGTRQRLRSYLFVAFEHASALRMSS